MSTTTAITAALPTLYATSDAAVAERQALATRANPGLDGVLHVATPLGHVDGTRGELIIGGYILQDFAPQATFEEVVWLLWNGRRPTVEEAAAFRAEIAAQPPLPDATLALLRAGAQAGVGAIDLLRMGVDSLSIEIAGDATHDPRQLAVRILAAEAQIVGVTARLARGEEPLDGDPGEAARGSIAGNLLYQLYGQPPTRAQVRALNTYFNSTAEHGTNASTFTARVIASTRSDLISTVVGGIGALKGPLHGGAPGPALEMVKAIGTPQQAEPYMRALLNRGERLMGFGHRVYRVRDPRADVLAGATQALYTAGHGDRALYELAMHVEEVALALLAELRPQRRLYTNVEFYTALVLEGLNLPVDLFTPAFAVSRTAGWIAHAFEQQASGKIIRPESVYIGPLLHWDAAS